MEKEKLTKHNNCKYGADIYATNGNKVSCFCLKDEQIYYTEESLPCAICMKYAEGNFTDDILKMPKEFR